MSISKYWTVSGVGGALFALTAMFNGALAAPQEFTRVDSISITDFTGRIVVEVRNGAVTADIVQGDRTYDTDLSQDGTQLLIEGEERPRRYNVSREINWRRHGDKAFEIFLEDYPTLIISAPAGTALDLDDAISIASIGDLDGDLIIDGGFVEVTAGNMASADVSVHGPGDIILGAVRNTLEASVHGSGDISAETAGDSDLSVHGSGNISVGDVSGEAEMAVHGSGDIETGDIARGLSASIHGSGDIKAGAAAQAGEFSIHGSGDIFLREINGPAEAEIYGSGSIEISEGRADALYVVINGSGDFDFGGVSNDLVANVNGSGAIDIARNEGTLRLSGRGDIRIGGVQFNDDD